MEKEKEKLKIYFITFVNLYNGHEINFTDINSSLEKAIDSLYENKRILDKYIYHKHKTIIRMYDTVFID